VKPPLLALVACCLCAIHAADSPPGRQIPLTDARLFLPQGAQPDASGSFDLTLHLHGAPAVVETNFLTARCPGVLANVTLQGLSAAYEERFKDSNVFWRILRETATTLQDPTAPPPRVRHVLVSSFSAGFGGVRQLLENPDIFARIDAVIMADSIYAGFAGNPVERKVNPDHMRGFLQFARAAADGRKRFLVSHTQLHTPTYASTRETADYLIAQLGGTREAMTESWPGNLRLLSRFQKGQCLILGFDGDTGQHHMEHLRQIRLFYQRQSDTLH